MKILISKQWLQKNYIDLNKTASECAKMKKCSSDTIYDKAKKYGLTKKTNGIYLDKSLFKPNNKGIKLSKEHKEKVRNSQLFRKEVLQFTKKGKKPIAEFVSINEATNSNPKFKRENIRHCCHGKRPSAYGYRWEFKKYRGEEIEERKQSLDFTLELEDITKGLTANLPSYPKVEAMQHYNRKFRQIFR